mgnify:CR=1 FL=1
MANYKGLDCVMGEITHMACAAKDSIHEQHVYEYFAAMEKYVHTAVPQLIADYLTEFREKLIVEFETYFNGERMHHADIAQAITEIIAESVDSAIYNLKIII